MKAKSIVASRESGRLDQRGSLCSSIKGLMNCIGKCANQMPASLHADEFNQDAEKMLDPQCAVILCAQFLITRNGP